MAKSELQSTVAKWSQIASAFRAAKKPDSLWRPLATQDIQGVMQGRASMAQAEILDALAASIKQAPIVQHEDSGSWNPLDIAGNVASDVGNIAWNFVPGVIHYATSLPQQIQDFAKLAERDPATQQKYGMETSFDNPLDFAEKLVRNASKVPVFAPLIPGLHTAANLTTDTGRQEIGAHPGFTALDILPVAYEGGKLATAGRDVEAASALESLQRGNPVQAGYRATHDALSKLHLAPERANVAKMFENAGMSSWIVNRINRPLSVLDRGAGAEMQRFVRTQWLDTMRRLPEETQVKLTTLVQHWNPSDLTEYFALPAEQRVLIDSTRDLVNHWAEEAINNGEVTAVRGPNGKIYPYANDSKVGMTYRRAARDTEMLGQAHTKLTRLAGEVESRAQRLASGSGKVRRFMEDDASYNARPDGPISAATIADSMQPLTESFADLDPRQVYQGIDTATMPTQARTAINKDLHLLSEHNGYFAQLRDALTKGDLKTARTAMTQIHRIFRKGTWDYTPYAKTFREYMTEMRKEMLDLTTRARKHTYASKLHDAAVSRHAAYQEKFAAVANRASTRFQEHLDVLSKTPPASFHKIMEETLRSNVTNEYAKTMAAHGIFSTQQVQAAFQTIRETSRMDELKTLIGDEEFKAIFDSSMKMWTDIAGRGFDPIWMHDVSSAQLDYLMHPKVLDSYYKPRQFNDYTFNLGRSMHSVYASLVGAKSELVRSAITKEYVDSYLMPHVKTTAEVMPRYEEIARAQGSDLIGHTPAGRARDLMMKDYAVFDPARYGLSPWIKATRDEEMLVPKGVERSLHIIESKPGSGLPFVGERSKLMHVYKYAVLTGPRHMAHVMLGGMVFGAVRDPMFVRFLGQGHALLQALREGDLTKIDPALHEPLAQMVQSLHGVTDDGIWYYSQGQTMGRLAAQAAGVPGRFMSRLEEAVSNTYRISSFLSAKAKGMDIESALSEALKTYVDMDNMTAIERQVAKTVMPFYGFTKHILRYAFTLPVDHPMRVAILARLASIERKDAGDALPATMNMLFQLGSPDADGNVATVDYKSANPFRSMYNTFTLAGVLSSLNPYMSTLMQSAGINVLSATPELYPDLQVDPQTGHLVARHDRTNIAMNALEAFIPEFSAVDHFITLTDRMKSLKANNPEAYHRALWSSLNMPFAMSSYNLPHEMQKLEAKRFKQAQNDVSAALQSNDFSYLRGYNQVPVPSLLKPYLGNAEYAPPDTIARLWGLLNAQTPGDVSPKAVIPRPRTRSK